MVAELTKKYSLEVEIIKKTDVGLLKRIGMPKFPAVELDGTILSEGRDITAEELEREIQKRSNASV